MRIHFLSPKQGGRPLRGKRSRKFEAAGFEASGVLRETERIEEAQLVYLRNVPEDTSDGANEHLLSALEGSAEARVLNHPRSLFLHDSKDRSFAIWREQDLPTPAFAICEEEEDALAFARQHPHLLLRVNNEACGDDTALMHEPSERTLRKAYRRLTKRASKLRKKGRGDTRVIAVEHLGEADANGLHSTFRVFVVGDATIGGYALVSPEEIIHSSSAVCGSERELEAFLRANTRLDELLADADFTRLATRAVRALDLDVACLDFVLAKDRPVLLEANALWSPSYSWAGGKAGEAHFRAAEDEWRARAASYCAWMDRTDFYRRLYDQLPRIAVGSAPPAHHPD